MYIIACEEIDKAYRNNFKYLPSIDHNMEEQFENYSLESCYRNMPALLPLNKAKDTERNRNKLIDEYKKCKENKSKVNNLISSI